jgi:hypothetical protein
MQKETIDCLYIFRTNLDAPVIITGSNEQAGHAPQSEHYTGSAIDFQTKASKEWVLFNLMRAGFRGIGYYTNNYWHADIRLKPLQWIGLNGSDKIEYIYSFDAKFKDMFLKYLA